MSYLGYGSLQCHWFIHARPGHKILLYFDDFEVEGNPAGEEHVLDTEDSTMISLLLFAVRVHFLRWGRISDISYKRLSCTNSVINFY